MLAAKAAVFVLLVIILIVYIGARNDDVQHKIDACIRRGGTPVVTGSRGLDSYHGCAGLEP